MVYPGQESTISIKILIPRRRPRAAVDQFNDGLEYYNKGFEKNYKKAAELFAKALQIDPTYSQAALYLGRTYDALFDQVTAKKYFRKAIEIDPDYLEARSSYRRDAAQPGRRGRIHPAVDLRHSCAIPRTHSRCTCWPRRTG